MECDFFHVVLNRYMIICMHVTIPKSSLTTRSISYRINNTNNIITFADAYIQIALVFQMYKNNETSKKLSLLKITILYQIHSV